MAWAVICAKWDDTNLIGWIVRREKYMRLAFCFICAVLLKNIQGTSSKWNKYWALLVLPSWQHWESGNSKDLMVSRLKSSPLGLMQLLNAEPEAEWETALVLTVWDSRCILQSVLWGTIQAAKRMGFHEGAFSFSPYRKLLSMSGQELERMWCCLGKKQSFLLSEALELEHGEVRAMKYPTARVSSSLRSSRDSSHPRKISWNAQAVCNPLPLNHEPVVFTVELDHCRVNLSIFSNKPAYLCLKINYA